MMKAIAYDHWHVFLQMTSFELVRELKKLAAKVKLSKFLKKPPRAEETTTKMKESEKQAPCFYCKITQAEKKVRVLP